jgi:DNA modification methylase
MSGRGTNLLVGAALGRRVVGYDMNPTNLAKVRSVALEHTDIDAADLQLYHSDGCVMEELADQQDCFDLITFDPPYAQGAERYTDDPRDLCNVRNMDAFYERLRECMCSCKRLIKKSDWEKKEFHPVVIKVGSVRRLQQGLHNMSTEVELIARDLGLVLHDTFFNHLYSQYAMFQMSRCIDHRYSAKVHETNLVFVKY